MNPLGWERNHLAALVAFCLAGAACGLIFARLDSPFHSLCSSSLSGEWANCSRVLIMWLQYPSAYWPMVSCGALIPGLIYYGFQLARR